MRVRRTPTSQSNINPTGINITIPERNQEATLYPQELTSAFLIQMLFQVCLTGNTSCDCLHLLQPLLICKFPLSIFYPLLSAIGHHVLHQVVIGINTIHPLVIYLLEDRPLIRLKELGPVKSHP